MILAAGSELPRKHLTAREFVLEGIRDAMLNGRLVAGQELDDHALAEFFGVSRTPVREALKVLEVQGFVSHRAFSKPVVAAVSPQRIEEVFLMRIALESTAAARAALAIDQSELKLVERCAASCRKALQRQDAVEWRRWNREFHTRLSAASGMPLLSREIDSLINLSSFYSTMFWSEIPDAFAEAQMEHVYLIEACRERDSERARKLMHDHLTASMVVQVRLAGERGVGLPEAASSETSPASRSRKSAAPRSIAARRRSTQG